MTKQKIIDEVMEMYQDDRITYVDKVIAKALDLYEQEVKDMIDDMSCTQAPRVCQCCQNLETLKRNLK